MAAAEGDVESKNEMSEVKDLATIRVDDKKVDTAVKFLLNPKVRNTPFERKISFLKNKGLNEKEINMAIEKSGTKAEQSSQLDSSSNRSYNNIDNRTLTTQASPSPQRSFFNSLSAVVVGGGFVYALGYVVQNYVLPYFNRRNHDDSQQLIEGIKELSKGISQLSSEMERTMKNLEDQIQEQRNLLSTVNSDLAVTKARVDLIPSDTTSLSDVKTELASVKSLLLGRRQFPQSPFVAPTQSPSIPAWQKAARRKEEDSVSTDKDDENAKESKNSDSDAERNDDNICINISNSNDSLGSNTFDISQTIDNIIVDFNDSADQEVEGIIKNNSNSLSSTYVKLDNES